MRSRARSPRSGKRKGAAMTTSKVQTARSSTTISRRRFLQASGAIGGGLALEVSVPVAALAEGAAPGVTEVTHWIVIHPDDRVVIRIARSEMGQGSMTGPGQPV